MKQVDLVSYPQTSPSDGVIEHISVLRLGRKYLAAALLACPAWPGLLVPSSTRPSVPHTFHTAVELPGRNLSLESPLRRKHQYPNHFFSFPLLFPMEMKRKFWLSYDCSFVAQLFLSLREFPQAGS